MYIATGQGQTTSGDKILMSTETSSHFSHLLQVSKQSLWSLILYNFFMILYMFTAPGQGQTAPRGQSFDVNRNVLSLHSFVASFKNMSLKSDFIHFFSLFNTCIYMYIAPGQGQTAPRGQTFDVNRKALSLYPFVASFKEISLKSDFIKKNHDLIHVYSPGAGGIHSPGNKVLMSTENSCRFSDLLLVSNHRRQ